jgi:hypothetical protein
MLFGLLGRHKNTTAPLGGRKPAGWARPGVEPLEGRLVPAAIRNLPGFLVNSLPAEDDMPSPQANIGYNINFFGVQTNQCFVNNNGNITLNQAEPTFTPFGLTTALGEPIIAPFFADVDTRGNSSLVTYGTDTLCGHQVFGVDWIHVNYFLSDGSASHVDKFNDFQLILIDRSDTGAGNFDIEFNYDTINWETGDASGGTNGLGGSSAVAGYSNGTGTAGTFAQLPGSGVNGAFLDGGPNALNATAIDANTPGRIHFGVRNGLVTVALDVSKGVEITNLVSSFHPFRLIANSGDQTDHGNLTIVDSHTGATAAEACLDETMSGASGLSGQFQLTAVYTNLPSNVTLLNPTGFTASGNPYISSPGPVNFGPGLAVRFAVRFHNPDKVALSTYLLGPSVRVFAGPFNPANL